MDATLEAMRKLWQAGARRDVSQLWAAVLQMGRDPIFVADRIAEAGQRDPSVAVPDGQMDEINDVAVNGPAAESPEDRRAAPGSYAEMIRAKRG